MRTTPALALFALLALLAGGAWLAGRARDADPAVPQSATVAAAAGRPRPQTLQASPAAQAWRERQAFEASMRRFLRDAPTLRPVERSEQARTLSASIDHYETSGGLSAGESLLLRSGLIKATVADPSRQAEQMADLMDRYRHAADQRMHAYATQHANDRRFQDYKARERAIVAETMALAEIPGGLSRDQYLRERLLQARLAAYR